MMHPRLPWKFGAFSGLGLLFLICIGLVYSSDEKPSVHWPSFRGPNASGVAQGQNLPDKWQVSSGENLRWKRAIPGLAHAGPVVWGQRLFVITAAGTNPDPTFKHGLYGSGEAADDKNPHRWMVMCLDKKTGDILWEKVAHEGVPKSKRHIKATQCNATPATNGEVVVAFFGSEGVFAYSMEGALLWKRDLGVLDMGAYNAPTYEWGPASSPIIYKDKVIVQCDTQKEDFIMALDIKTGKTVWETSRDELPSWGTPNVYQGEKGAELVANGSNLILGYNPDNGEELWRLGGSSQITAPTPVFTNDHIVVASGRRPVKPIFVIRPGSRGDLTLAEDQTSSDRILWSKRGVGPYMPTPLIVGNHLYILANQGIFDCYDLATGKEHYRQRVQHGGGGFSASPVAADGKIYLPSEDGDIFVVKAGPKYEVLATNDMGEILMATPAISEGTLYVRGRKTLFAIGH